ncbi:MAG: hypothetical protein CMG64_04660 [Candidatus Marinimicrobia bacterium]|nr:hypothetical protein [Candidatus Neomarinimicrobiota bacterium]
MLKFLTLFLCLSMILNASTLKGVVSYAGSNKTPKDLKMDSDPVCGNSHEIPPKKEDFILDKNNNFKNVLVWIEEIKYDGKLDSSPGVIDQIGCMYTPHVNAFTTGQKVLIKNSDKTLHNVNSKSKINESFNSAQPAGVPDIEKTFTSPEDPFYIKCDVHPWMKAWVLVADHPYFAITDENGNYSIENVPPGEYVINFWQEKLSNLPKKKYVTVSNTATVTIEEDKDTIQDYTFQKPIKKKK